jgi:prevent-host-death family protein
MRSVTHREMRNNSGEILRQVSEGETIQVTNRGEVAALIVPPGADPLADLEARGQARPPRRPLDTLRSLPRQRSETSSDAIVDDVRGRW